MARPMANLFSVLQNVKSPPKRRFSRVRKRRKSIAKYMSYIAHKCLSAIRQLHKLIAQRRRDERPVF